MPPDERTTKTEDRCGAHPGVASVARCELCDLPLCVDCAVPIRGRVIGRECLSSVIGSDGGATRRADGRQRRARPGLAMLGVSFGVGALASLVPWTQFGQSSGPFGAWGWSIRWSMLSAVSAGIGFVLFAVQWRRPRLTDRTAARVLGAIALVMGASAIMAGVHEPPFTRATAAPWVVLGASVLGIAGSIRANWLPRHMSDQGSPGRGRQS